ncbi:MAG: lipoate--protein ligase family protein [Thermoplasmatota archaeon]
MATAVRLILDGHHTAAENMARDESLLSEGAPTLRLYGWRPAAVSLGRAQSRAEVDLAAAAAAGVDVVQRATGGGAILHNEEEVTYAVVSPLAHPGLPRDIPGSFAFVSRGVVIALAALGLDAVIESSPTETRDPLCYVRRQGTNVFVGGKKISGGAQRRTASALLQHGTVIVKRDSTRMSRLFRADLADIRAKVTSLEREGVNVSREKLVDALVAGFGEAFSVREWARSR